MPVFFTVSPCDHLCCEYKCREGLVAKLPEITSQLDKRLGGKKKKKRASGGRKPNIFTGDLAEDLV